MCKYNLGRDHIYSVKWYKVSLCASMNWTGPICTGIKLYKVRLFASLTWAYLQVLSDIRLDCVQV